jgi:hypothetical protein
MPQGRDKFGKFTVNGSKAVANALKGKAQQSKKQHNVSVIVGYTQSYALKVHEDLMAVHPNGGQAKYLEQPARLFAKEIARMIRQLYKKGVPLSKSLVIGGMKIQRESQKLVPVQYGFLRASAFTKLE